MEIITINSNNTDRAQLEAGGRVSFVLCIYGVGQKVLVFRTILRKKLK